MERSRPTKQILEFYGSLNKAKSQTMNWIFAIKVDLGAAGKHKQTLQNTFRHQSERKVQEDRKSLADRKRIISKRMKQAWTQNKNKTYEDGVEVYFAWSDWARRE